MTIENQNDVTIIYCDDKCLVVALLFFFFLGVVFNVGILILPPSMIGQNCDNGDNKQTRGFAAR
jgi:hypothetical protein